MPFIRNKKHYNMTALHSLPNGLQLSQSDGFNISIHVYIAFRNEMSQPLNFETPLPPPIYMYKRLSYSLKLKCLLTMTKY